jgi:lysylphosphatidylglycerol synthetase-like protein (DUF2156 family)
MRIELNTPALLFPAISFLLLPYTNRYLALASLTRGLLSDHIANPDDRLLSQIKILRRRIGMIRKMQSFAVAAMLASMLCMLMIFLGFHEIGNALFFVALVMMVVSLVFSLWEIQLSTEALNVQLQLLESDPTQQS